jgi:hypothetical protein
MWFIKKEMLIYITSGNKSFAVELHQKLTFSYTPFTYFHHKHLNKHILHFTRIREL